MRIPPETCVEFLLRKAREGDWFPVTSGFKSLSVAHRVCSITEGLNLHRHRHVELPVRGLWIINDTLGT